MATEVNDKYRTVCRVCISEWTELQNIFTTNMNGMELAQMLSICVGSAITPDDGLPPVICSGCLINLEAAFEFQELCRTSETELRRKLHARGDDWKFEGEDVENMILLEEIKVEPISLTIDAIESPLESVHIDNEPSHAKSPLYVKPSLSKAYKCDVCGHIFDRLYNLRRHSALHKNDSKPFECPLCFRRFKAEFNLLRHKVLIHAEKKGPPYACVSCDREFANQESLAAHMRIHPKQTNATIESFICEICPEAFSDRNKYSFHMRTHKVGKTCSTEQLIERTDEQPYQCDMCDERFDSFDQMNQHMNTHASREMINDPISLTLNSVESRQRADNASNGESPFFVKPSLSKAYKCDVCGKIFDRLFNLRRHILLHKNSSRTFECPFCFRRFKEECNLQRHKILHSKKQGQSNDREFANQESLAAHMRINTSQDIQNDPILLQFDAIEDNHPLGSAQSAVKPLNDVSQPNEKSSSCREYKCDVCGKIFDRLFNLRRHMTLHEDNRERFDCPLCSRRFKTEYNLLRHKQLHSERIGQPYRCASCDREFAERRAFAAHIRIHSEQTNATSESDSCEICPKVVSDRNKCSCAIRSSTEPYQCELCEKRFNTSDQVNRHMRTHSAQEIKVEPISLASDAMEENSSLESAHIVVNSKEKIRLCVKPSSHKEYQCDVCGKIFDRLFNLDRHAALHINDNKPFECTICYKRFKAECNLLRHKIIHSEKIAQFYACVVCDREFCTQQSLAGHMRIHPKQKNATTESVRCDICPKVFSNRNKCIIHMRTHKLGKVFTCSIDKCRRTFSSSSRMIDHLNMHKEGKPYVCDICMKSFRKFNTLKNHMRTHSGEKPFLCAQCGRAFKFSGNLRMHLIRHEGNRPYACTECPRRFSCNGSLRVHMNTHTGLKPYTCDLCHQTFTQQYTLSSHRRKHTGERPYPCDMCDKRFNSSDHLKRHMRTHTGEKPYKCKFCDRAYAQSNDLVKHLRSHVGANTYQCTECPQAFRLLSELREHGKIHFIKEKSLATATAVS